MKLLLSLALLTTGCVTIAPGTAEPIDTAVAVAATPTRALPTATPTPRPTAEPTARPTRRPTPEPVQGTPWFDYLIFGLDSATAWEEIFGLPMDGFADIINVGNRGLRQANEDLAWLNSHEPQPCYADLYDQHLTTTYALMDAMQAASEFDLDAPDLLTEATEATSRFSDMLGSTSC